MDDTHTIWKSDPGLCNYVAGYFGVIPVDPAHDGNVATVEVNVNQCGSLLDRWWYRPDRLRCCSIRVPRRSISAAALMLTVTSV